MKQLRGAAEKHLQKKREEKCRASHSKFERLEVMCLTLTNDVNVVYTVNDLYFLYFT